MKLSSWQTAATTVMLLIIAAISPSGCAILGVASSALPPPTIQPRYTGLAGQKVGVPAEAEGEQKQGEHNQ